MILQYMPKELIFLNTAEQAIGDSESSRLELGHFY